MLPVTVPVQWQCQPWLAVTGISGAALLSNREHDSHQVEVKTPLISKPPPSPPPPLHLHLRSSPLVSCLLLGLLFAPLDRKCKRFASAGMKRLLSAIRRHLMNLSWPWPGSTCTDSSSFLSEPGSLMNCLPPGPALADPNCVSTSPRIAQNLNLSVFRCVAL